MSRPLSLEQKKFIEKQAELGVKSKQIAKALGVSVWVVYKWRQRLKKGAPYKALWAVPDKVL